MVQVSGRVGAVGCVRRYVSVRWQLHKPVRYLPHISSPEKSARSVGKMARSDASPSRSAVTSVSALAARKAGVELLEKAVTWESPLGRALLHIATILLLRPAFLTISQAIAGFTVQPDFVEETKHIGPLTLCANLTRLRVDGLQTLGPFPELTSAGAKLVTASSSIGTVDASAWVSARLSGPLGAWSHSQRLRLHASLTNVSLEITWRCELRKGAVAKAFGARARRSLGPGDSPDEQASSSWAGMLDPSSVSLGVERVALRVGGELMLQVDPATVDEGAALVEDNAADDHGAAARGVGEATDAIRATGSSPPPPIAPVWRLASRAFGSLLRGAVEEHGARAIHEGLASALEEATGDIHAPIDQEEEREI